MRSATHRVVLLAHQLLTLIKLPPLHSRPSPMRCKCLLKNSPTALSSDHAYIYPVCRVALFAFTTGCPPGGQLATRRDSVVPLPAPRHIHCICTYRRPPPRSSAHPLPLHVRSSACTPLIACIADACTVVSFRAPRIKILYCLCTHHLLRIP